jgi:hypothetical protein
MEKSIENAYQPLAMEKSLEKTSMNAICLIFEDDRDNHKTHKT